MKYLPGLSGKGSGFNPLSRPDQVTLLSYPFCPPRDLTALGFPSSALIRGAPRCSVRSSTRAFLPHPLFGDATFLSNQLVVNPLFPAASPLPIFELPPGCSDLDLRFYSAAGETHALPVFLQPLGLSNLHGISLLPPVKPLGAVIIFFSGPVGFAFVYEVCTDIPHFVFGTPFFRCSLPCLSRHFPQGRTVLGVFSHAVRTFPR